jgi:hypothetical protein
VTISISQRLFESSPIVVPAKTGIHQTSMAWIKYDSYPDSHDLDCRDGFPEGTQSLIDVEPAPFFHPERSEGWSFGEGPMWFTEISFVVPAKAGIYQTSVALGS